ncbi:uncharacterized protein LOC132207893 isoform X2 [Stegostoma tigrinum]|uniref:uncharacterized protein LOC132207893 isoform X2 n=1 Tax=Stegostoma tigrinum TaxID=3053191 RepID=UPI0028700A7B|nr:uncharacterized protein LOC132207893 isoform X2 [Stegostoma tigrinum]
MEKDQELLQAVKTEDEAPVAPVQSSSAMRQGRSIESRSQLLWREREREAAAAKRDGGEDGLKNHGIAAVYLVQQCRSCCKGRNKAKRDTIIALEASSRYYFAFLKREEEINMKIQFHGFGSPIENTIHLRRHNALTEKELKFPLGRKIHIKLTGQGNGTLTNHTMRLF